MRNFLKIFFASFLYLIVFSLILLFILIAWVSALATKDKPTIANNSVLMLDLGQQYREQVQKLPLGNLINGTDGDIPGVYDVVRLIAHAKTDNNIKGIYILANMNPNGFAASEEIRNSILDFKKSGKFVIAYGDVISQKAYYIANVADKIYANPAGFVEWVGYSIDYAFVKGTLDKLDVEPQVFYAGKFKSATEPFRTTEMTPENELQTSVWMNDLYAHFLQQTSETRKIDTATLHALANNMSVTNVNDAVRHKLIDAAKYDDEVKDEFRSRLKIDSSRKLSIVSINTYYEAANYAATGSDRIALIYAEGDIIDGKGGSGVIGSYDFRNLIRKARQDKSIKAIVFRVNSGGGSALASEVIWRELQLAKKDKPVVVSFGDVAASGGYYIACAADSIFASPTTITGSIGVFGLIPNMQGFFKNKLGITFDGVKTGPHADMGTPTRPLTETEKKYIQAEVERIYSQFKIRVAEGRKRDTAYVDSIAQGRVWTGTRASGIGLIDKFGGLHEAVQCAARLANTTSFRLREYPQPESLFEQLFNTRKEEEVAIKNHLGEKNFKLYKEMMRVQQMTNSVQARLPFTFFIN